MSYQTEHEAYRAWLADLAKFSAQLASAVPTCSEFDCGQPATHHHNAKRLDGTIIESWSFCDRHDAEYRAVAEEIAAN